jgi:hypothetical protein
MINLLLNKILLNDFQGTNPVVRQAGSVDTIWHIVLIDSQIHPIEVPKCFMLADFVASA